MSDVSPLPDPVVSNPHWSTYRLFLRNFFCFWLRYRARGMEHLPATGGALLLINHQSFFDPLLVGLPLSRPVSYLARDNLFRVPVIGRILRHTYVVPISREAASTSSLKEAIRRLEHGFYVGIFPEGTRTENGTVGEFKPGFLLLLRRTSVPVIPVGIAGAFEAFPKGCAVSQARQRASRLRRSAQSRAARRLREGSRGGTAGVGADADRALSAGGGKLAKQPVGRGRPGDREPSADSAAMTPAPAASHSRNSARGLQMCILSHFGRGDNIQE